MATNTTRSSSMIHSGSAPGSTTSSVASNSPRGNASRSSQSVELQSERRKQIREIMADPSLSQTDKNRAVQSLMDGRRRSSLSRSARSSSVCSEQENEDARSASEYVSTMAKAAAAAAEYYSSDDEGDSHMSDAAADDIYGYGRDDRSVASSVTHTSHRSADPHQHHHALSLAPGQYRQIHGRSFSLQDWNENDRVAVAPHATYCNPAQISRLMEQSRPNCRHYERNCTIISPCCGLAFGCRICHDECPVLPQPLHSRKSNDDYMLGDKIGGIKHAAHFAKMERRRSMPTDFLEEEETHHTIDRFAIREVICRGCYMRQSSKTNKCITCGIQFGDYHCTVCNLWMGSSENPYHCIDCGFCRVGGRVNFAHCHDCGMCIDKKLFDNHNCKHGKYMSNCPVCQEDLFRSRQASHEMPCGHAIHWHCFKELTSYDTRCPVCKKTAETPEQMASTWSAIAVGISLQPVPPDMARVVNIVCNDCEEHDVNRRWHFLGVRCMNCLSFNTAVEQIVMNGRDAAGFLDRLEQRRAGSGGVPANINISTMTTSLPPTEQERDDPMEEDVPDPQGTSSGTDTGLDPNPRFV